jgi:beta-1,4-mannooligosaccharide/beta-1,4-mannosyl-N-acetylglucosamine phosphorylase
VMNPAAILVDGETVLVMRVVDQVGSSHLTVARSANGVDGWRIDPTPLLAPSDERLPFETYGCEDPRVVWLADRQEFALTYTGFSPLGAGVCLATTKDFKSVERYGLVLAPNNKDAALFPRQINGLYWMLHRPSLGQIEHVWITDSADLIHWGRPKVIISERGGPWWDGEKVGAGPPPIETKDGWLVIYHGIKGTSHGPIYRVGLALLDIDDPSKVLKRLERWVFGPSAPYESQGFIPGVVFPTGAIVRGDEVWMYYGAADTRIALATAKLQTLLDALASEGDKGMVTVRNGHLVTGTKGSASDRLDGLPAGKPTM